MTRFLARLCMAGLCACAVPAMPALAEDVAPAALPSVPTMEAAAKAPALVGTLTDAELWRAYKAKFLTENGRIVDTANGMVSHTEGQGYACCSRSRRTTGRPSNASGAGPAPISGSATTSFSPGAGSPTTGRPSPISTTRLTATS